MKNEKLRVGMIGAGSFARAHLQAWHEVEGAEVVAITNRTRQRAETLASEFGIPEVIDNQSALMHRDDIDAVSISMPHNLHAPIALEAIENGKHVFCEKPLAMSLDEAMGMWRAAEAAGVKTGIQFRHRSATAFIHLRELLSDGYLGSLQHVEFKNCYDLSCRDERFPLIWRFQRSIAGAGALGDLGVYAIDMARWLIGEFDRVCATMKTFIERRPTISDSYNAREVLQMAKEQSYPEGTGSESGVVGNEDECNILVDFNCGAHGFIRASRFHQDREIRIYGSRGEIRVARADDRLMGKIDGAEDYSEIPVPNAGGTANIVAQFVSNIRNDTDLPPTFFDGLKAQEIMEAAMVSADEERWVRLPMARIGS